MKTTKLTGWLLIIGPIGSVIVWLGLSSLLVGTPATDTSAGTLQHNLSNETGWMVTGFAGTLVTIAMLCGMILFSKIIASDGNPFATIAALLYPVMFAIIAASIGLSVGAIDYAKETSVADAAFLETTSNQISGIMSMIWGLGLLLLGLAIMTSKYVLPVLGVILAVAGIVQVSTMFYDADTLGNIIWMIGSLIMAVVGIIMLTKEK